MTSNFSFPPQMLKVGGKDGMERKRERIEWVVQEEKMEWNGKKEGLNGQCKRKRWNGKEKRKD